MVMRGVQQTVTRKRALQLQRLQKTQNLRKFGSGLGGRQAWKPVSQQKEVAATSQHETIASGFNDGYTLQTGRITDTFRDQEMINLLRKRAEPVAPGGGKSFES